MFPHILVPTDFSDRSIKALEVAAELAGHEGGRVTLLHVVETIDNADYEELKPFYEKLNRQSLEKLEAMTGPYRESSVVIQPVNVLGKRITEILQYAEAHDVDLIVLGSHRIDPNDLTLGWGTISYKVGILARCPVMLVK